jgi:hypothetical protein
MSNVRNDGRGWLLVGRGWRTTLVICFEVRIDEAVRVNMADFSTSGFGFLLSL